MKAKLLAIVGSQRKNGNGFLLANAVLNSVDADYDVIQLADKEIGFCDVCGQCVDKDCVVEDDLNDIIVQMRNADGIVFVVPKYLTAPSKFLAFLERLASIVHMRRFMGYTGPVKNPDFRLFSQPKPFCIFALSGTGKFKSQDLRTVAEYIEYLGLKPVLHNRPPFIAANVKSGDEKGEVLRNKTTMEQCKELAQKLVKSTNKQHRKPPKH